MGVDFWAASEMRAALLSRDMGAVVRAYRGHPVHGRRPLPQAVVARWLMITQSQLSRIESGKNQLRDLDKLSHYAQRLKIPAELLWFEMEADEERLPHHRTNVVRLPHGPVVPAASMRTEPAVARSLLNTLKQYVTTDNLIGPRSLLPVVAEQMRFVRHLLAQDRGPDRSALLFVAARFTEFTGWLHQDTGKLQSAMEWSNRALDLAHEANDLQLAAYIQMRKSNIASDARKPVLTIGFAQAALRSADAMSPRLRAVAFRQEAHGHALAGDYDSCSKAVDRALRHAALEPDDEGDIARYCTPSYVEMEAAHCWVELGRPAQAMTTLQQGIAKWQPDFRRDLGLGLARLAVAHAVSGQIDESAAVAQHALVIAAETRSHRTAQQLHRTAELMAGSGAHDRGRRLSRTLRTTLM